MPVENKQRLAKAMAHAGVCSRRKAEELIQDGHVKVNGKLVETPAFTVGDRDKIMVDNQLINRKKHVRLWLYHKPVGLLVTHDDPQGRPTVFEKLPEKMGRVISVGRLDLNSEGLLILTNDGEVSRQLEHPKTKLKRVYRVRVFGDIDLDRLKQIEKGVIYEDVRYKPAELDLKDIKSGRKNNWIHMTLTEGKNREIRKLMEFAGLRVNRLIRKEYGPFHLGKIEPGQVMEVPKSDVRKLLEVTKGKKVRT